jgi:hypothetical protein
MTLAPDPIANATERNLTRPGLEGWAYWSALTLAFVLALALRAWNIDFGLPSHYHPDESAKAWIIQNLFVGKFRGYLSHPGLLLDSVAFAAAIRRALGLPIEVNDVLLTGRWVVALIGALSVWPMAALATMLFGRRAGALAAAMLAVAPLHVVHSRYYKEDVWLAFWILVSLVGLAGWLRAQGMTVASRPSGEAPGARGGSRRWLLLAVAAGGLAMGSKYVGIVVIGMVLLAWKRHSGKSWRQAWPLAALALALFVLVTPELFNPASYRVKGLGYEIAHGVKGKGFPKLFFVQWPDLGFYFLFHGLGWGLSWPLTLLGCVGIVLGWRARKERPDIGWTAIAAVTWYVVAELTPLKRGGDAERYVLPCVPLWGIMAAGVIACWRPARAWRWRLSPAAWRWAPLLLVFPLAHSVALSASIADDTRQQAARWLAANGPRPPYTIVTIGDITYHLDASLVPGATMTYITGSLKKPANKKAFDQAAVLTLSSLDTGRYENFSLHSKLPLRQLAELRAGFPVVKVFQAPFYAQYGFHNPRIEVRFRAPIVAPAMSVAPAKPATPSSVGKATD